MLERMILMKKRAVLLSILLAGSVHLPVVYGAAAENKDSYSLPDVFVYGNYKDEIFHGGQIVRKNNLGIIGKADFMDVPFNVMSLSQKSIDMNRSSGNTLLEVLTLDPTVTSDGDNTYNDVHIRGYRLRSQDYYINGVPGMLSPSSIPTNFVDRVEIISGPNTLVNGIGSYSASAAGTVNLVPKVAEDETKIVFRETFSGKSHFAHELDLGTRFGKDKEWGVRANIGIEDGATRFRNEKYKENNAFVNVDYRGEKTSAQLLVGHREVRHKGCQTGIRLGGHSLPKPPQGDANFQPSWGEYSHANDIVTFSLAQQLNPSAELFFKCGYHTDEWDPVIMAYYPRLTDEKGNFITYVEMIRENRTFRGYAGGVRLKADTGQMHHDIVLSADRLEGEEWIEYDTDYYDDLLPPYKGNIYDKSSFDKMIPPKAPNWGYHDDDDDKVMKGISFVDRIVTDDERWSFLLGLRHQNVSEANKDSSKFSPNFGLMYALNPHVKVYANYMESLGRGRKVGRRYANKGEYLPPQTTEQYELGMKWDAKRLGGSFSIFSVEQENLHVDANNRYGYNGRQKNQGGQVTVFGHVTPKLNLLGGIMYLNAKQKGGKNDGRTIAGIPKWNFTLSTEYQMNAEWSLTGRMVANSKAPMNPLASKHVPGWWRLDLGAQYKHTFANGDALRVGLNVFNVLNREYWVVQDAVAESVSMHGPRSLVLSLAYDF